MCRSSRHQRPAIGPHPSALRTPHSALRTREAFTFVEVLFAIIILGVGSIMIAGMLPVAIKQSSDTRNALAGQAACDAGYAYVKTLTSGDPNALPPTDNIVPAVMTVPTSFNGVTFGTSPGRILPLTFELIAANVTTPPAAPGPLQNLQSLTGNRIIASDPRTQWLAFYGRAADAATAKLIILSLRLQNADAQQSYAKIDDANPSTTLTNGFNNPLLATVEIAEGGALDPDFITFPASNGPQVLGAIDTNAFVIVANSPAVAAEPDRPARNNGRIFRLGNRLPEKETGGNQVYALVPGFDLVPLNNGADHLPNTADDFLPAAIDASLGAGTNTQAWVVGRSLRDINFGGFNATLNPYLGVVQDVAVLSAELPLSK